MGWISGLERKLWCCASTAQQQQKHWYADNTVLAINAKHRVVWAAMRRAVFIPARPSVHLMKRMEAWSIS